MDRRSAADEKRFEEIYQQEAALPEGLEGSVDIVSCLAWREEQQVYLVRDASGHLSVLKKARGNAAALLKVEAKNLQNLRFSFIPRYMFHMGDEQEYWLQREYIPGDTLWEIVERNGSFEEKEAGELLCRLCELAGQLHSAQPPVICRDIKPQNIVITPEGNLFLIDIGTARAYREEAACDTVFVGTRLTAAPEQYGYRQSDCRTDVYALGVVYLYLLTGRLDVQKHSVKNLLSPQARQIIEKCTRLDPEERYQSCPELKEAVREAAGCVTEKIKKRKIRRWRGLGAGLICGAAALGCFLYVRALNQPYQFHSELIELAVRTRLGKEEGETVRKEELAQIETLRICGSRILGDEEYHTVQGGSHYINEEGDNMLAGAIHDLTDCAYMTGLRTLVADQQQITDLSPLEGLSLENLSVSCNPITDLSPLEHMDSLQTLYIDETQVSDLGILTDLGSLTELGIADTQVTDLRPLKGLPLEKLFMFVPSEADWEVIAGLPLKKLMVHSYSQELEQVIGTVTSLEDLIIYQYESTDLDPLLGLENLTRLSLYAGKLESLEGSGRLANLDTLMIGKTPVTDISPLEANESLTYLTLDNSLVTDFSPLRELKSLQHLECSQSQKAAIDQAIPAPEFEIVVHDDEPLE